MLNNQMKHLLVLFCLLLSPSLILCQGFLRIINGTAATSGQLPHQVALHTYFNSSADEPHICGGTIISNRWILTAAHCLREPNLKLVKVVMIAGQINKQSSRRWWQVILAKDVIVHPNYNRDTVANDIGLLRLTRRLRLNNNVRAAKLPRDKNTYVNRSAISSGWGLMENEQPTEELQYINVTIISNEQCEQEWNKELKDRKKFMLDSFLCIDSTQGLPCRGDSGGPLLLDDGTRTIVGIVSHGFDPQCRLRVPDIFTRVSSYVNWIEKYTGRLK